MPVGNAEFCTGILARAGMRLEIHTPARILE